MLIAAGAFAVILSETKRDHAKINWQVEQRSKVRNVANIQIIAAVTQLLWPFNLVIREIWQKGKVTVDLDRLDEDVAYMIELLSMPTVRAGFGLIDLRTQPNVFPKCLWWEFLARHAQDARELLNQAAAKYSGYLSPDTLVAIEELRADEFVRFRLPDLGTLVSTNQGIQPFTLTYALEQRGKYVAFHAMLTKVAQLLDFANERRSAA